MCGIFGAVAPAGVGPPLTTGQAERLRDRMADRGPDGAGLLSRGSVVLAHRRLAIRDPAAGAQPWTTADGSVAVVYNGELYNDGELRAELARRGEQFRTRCDTELIPAAYRAWGDDCVTRFNGDFAFGLYDFARGRLLLARDRCGAKPLFFGWIDATFYFASAVAAIRRAPGFKARPNWPVLSHYLSTLRLTLGRETVFENLFTLQPGERLVAEGGRTTIDRWWSPPTEASADPESPADFAAAADDFERRLRDAVKIRLTGDVPAGLFLSGGVDSSLLGRLARDETDAALPAGCGVGTEGKAPTGDETFSAAAAETIGCRLTTSRVESGEYRERWLDLLNAYDTPVSTPTDAVIYRLSEDVRRSAGFVLGGEGADELHCGYAVPHFAGHDYDRAAGFVAGRWTPPPNVSRLFRASLNRSYGREAFASPADHYFASNSLIPTAAKPQLLRPAVWEAAGCDKPMRRWYGERFDELGDSPTAAKTTRLLHRVNLESLLSRLDSASMRAGLEVRPVYADGPLTEAAFRLPQAYKIGVDPAESAPFLAAGELAARGSLRDKRLLRTVARRVLPAVLADRPKASFPTPVAAWLGGDWAGWAAQTLRTSPFARAAFAPEALEELAANPARAGMWLWPVLNLALWGDRQFGG